MRAFRSVGLAVMLSVAVVGCGLDLTFGLFDPIRTRTVQLSAVEGANRDFPIAVDLVLVNNRALLEALQTVSARDWFARKQQFSNDFPNGFTVVHWELVPGQVLPPTELPSGTSNVLAGIIFANYFADGEHRARVDRIEEVVVELQEDSLAVRAAGGS